MRDCSSSSSACPRICIVSLPLFTPGTLWVWRCCCCCCFCCMFPSAAAPHRLLKTGYGANNFKRKEIHSPLKKQTTIACQSALPKGFFLTFAPSGYWPRSCPSACLNYNCSPPPRSPWSEWEEEPRGGGGTYWSVSVRRTDVGKHIDSMHLCSLQKSQAINCNESHRYCMSSLTRRL